MFQVKGTDCLPKQVHVTDRGIEVLTLCPKSWTLPLLIYDAPVVVQCYTNETDLETYAEELREFLTRIGQEASQGAVGLVIDRDYLEIRFPVAEE